MALGSIARVDPKTPGLLPGRIHNFFRGLSGFGLHGPELREIVETKGMGDLREDVQPAGGTLRLRRTVLEMYTCRNSPHRLRVSRYTDMLMTPAAFGPSRGEALRWRRAQPPAAAALISYSKLRIEDVGRTRGLRPETGHH